MILKCVPLELSCPNDYPFENKNTKECIENVVFDDLISENYAYSENALNKIIESFNEKISTGNLDTSEDIILNNDKFVFQLTTPEKQKYYLNNDLYNNISNLDLKGCEDILKSEYGINGSLAIMKIDLKRNDTPSTQVEYQVINPKNGEILELSKCKNIKIDIFAPVNFTQDYFEKINQVKKQGYDIFNPQDYFYNDICSPYNSENGTDVLLKDRKIDFYNPNLSLCEDNCEYKLFNVNSSKVKCECKIKTDIEVDSTKVSFSPKTLLENFYSFDKYTNYKVLKCFNLVFDLNRLKTNIGSYILIFLILLFIGVLIFKIITQTVKYMELFDRIIKLNMDIDKKIQKNEKKKNKEKYDDEDKKESKKKRKKDKKDKKDDGDIKKGFKDKRKSVVPPKNMNRLETNEQIINKTISEEKYSSQISNPPKKKLKNKISRGKSTKAINFINIESNMTTSKEMNINSLKNRNKYNSSKNIKNNNKTLKIERNKSSKLLFTNNNLKNEGNKIEEEEKETENKRINHISEVIPKEKRSKYFIDNEINGLDYEQAVNIDFRSFIESYWSLLKQTHLFIFTFVTNDDYNLFLSKVSLFIISFALNITSNAFFFSDDSMHKLYEDYGEFDFLYNLPQTIFSILISSLFTTIFELLALSEESISEFKEEDNLNYMNKEKKKIIRFLKKKSIAFFIIGTIILIFFWYYLSCFCAVYQNTQVHLIKDTFISFATGMIYPFFLTIIPTIIRIPALRKKNICLYKFSRILTTVIGLI